MESDTDVKELVPEFYNTEECVGEFMLNLQGLELGATQDGENIGDVALPPWANGARDFVRKSAAALESEIVTENLPRWIDLIFGCAQPFHSAAALLADNVFYPITCARPPARPPHGQLTVVCSVGSAPCILARRSPCLPQITLPTADHPTYCLPQRTFETCLLFGSSFHAPYRA
jgi:hypothetical protein